MIEDDELLTRYNDTWNNFSYSIKKEFDSELTCNKKDPKTKINSYGEMPKVGSHYICLAVMLIEFVLKKDENYYLQV